MRVKVSVFCGLPPVNLSSVCSQVHAKVKSIYIFLYWLLISKLKKPTVLHADYRFIPWQLCVYLSLVFAVGQILACIFQSEEEFSHTSETFNSLYISCFSASLGDKLSEDKIVLMNSSRLHSYYTWVFVIKNTHYLCFGFLWSYQACAQRQETWAHPSEDPSNQSVRYNTIITLHRTYLQYSCIPCSKSGSKFFGFGWENGC